MSVEAILGSAVIAAIISGIVAYATSKKQNDLQYITGERKEWRGEIRKLAERLNGANYKETLQILTELKVRINALGNNGIKEYARDSHIWELINEIEEKKLPKDILSLKQKQLIEYLSLLLKSDWERSKKEVKGDMLKLFSMFFIGSALLYCIWRTFEYSKCENLKWVWIVCSITLNGMTICFEKDIIRNQNEQNKGNMLLRCWVIWIILAFLNLIIYIFAMQALVNEFLYSGKENSGVILFFLVYAYGVIAQFWSQMDKAYEHFGYISSINIVMERYKKLESAMVNLDSDTQKKGVSDK